MFWTSYARSIYAMCLVGFYDSRNFHVKNVNINNAQKIKFSVQRQSSRGILQLYEFWTPFFIEHLQWLLLSIKDYISKCDQITLDLLKK